MNLECSKVESPCNLLESLYAYFSHNPQRTQEFIGLVDIVETKGQWILKNINTRWILMLLALLVKLPIIWNCFVTWR
jgi:hypothetical protein